MSYQGFQSSVGLLAFVRFLEFYCFLLDEDSFYYFIENAFKFKYFNRDKEKKEYISRNLSELRSQSGTNDLPPADRSTFNHIYGQNNKFDNRMPGQLQNQLPDDSISMRESRRGVPLKDQSEHKVTFDVPHGMSGSQYSPHNESVITRKSEDIENINKFNDQIQNANFKKMNVEGNSQVSEVMMEKLRKNIRSSGNFCMLLEIEYEMTRKSDSQGNIDFDVFSSVLENCGALTSFNEKNINDLYMTNLERGAMHVQRFVNDLRSQISPERENWAVDKFDMIRNPATDTIHIEDMRKVFKSKQFKWRKQSIQDVEENYQYMIDLFNCLNLSIKKTSEFDLDDFLYLFDNFSFMFLEDAEFKQMLAYCF
jgi:hypothetical protein